MPYIFTVFTQHEYDKWLSYQEVKRQIAKRKQAEAQERSKKEMLKALEGEDISHIDINSEEGNMILMFFDQWVATLVMIEIRFGSKNNSFEHL